ncbi:hypothetical protein O3Q51_10760 [Cryomorphaceae bacterium 1068]|nr:hypothetical protein [Cryomorphaceae bacterium 1068]
MTEIKRILIVAYSFPPQGGIGGRRWAKFAKQFRRSGIEVEVISADMPAETDSSWTADVDGIPVFRFKTSFPASLKMQPARLIDKVRYRMALRKMVLKTKGTPYDRAALDQLAFRSLFSQRMEKFNPDVIIATGAPFDLLYFAAIEMENHPDVLSLADLRDPWVNGSAFGYSALSNERLEIEKEKEAKVVDTFDLVTMPWPQNIEELQQRHPDQAKKLSVLPHFFDDDDLKSKGEVENPPDLIYGGAIYEGLEPALAELSAFAKAKELKIEIRTGSLVDSSIQNEFFKALPPLSSKEFFTRVKASKYSLLFLPEGKRYGLTKLYELAACQKPILAIGKPSNLSELIENKSLGQFIHEDRLTKELMKAIDQSKEIEPNQDWVNSHSLSKITADLTDLLKSELNAK